MNNHTVKSRAKSSADIIFVFMIFAMFVCALLTAVLTFAKLYRISGERITARFDSSTASSLILQKLHSYDYDGGISVSKSDGTDLLCLHEEIDGEKYTTYIYCYGDNLCELFVSDSHQFNATDGNALVSADSFNIRSENGRIIFSVGNENETPTEQTYMLRSGERTVTPDEN